MRISNRKKVRAIFQEFDFHSEIEIPLHAFEEYLIFAEQKLHCEIRERIEQEERENEDSEDEYFSAGHHVNLEMMQLHYISMFIFLHSFLEKKMQCFCKIVGNISDECESGILNYKNCLKHVNIDITESEEWCAIIRFSDLRNVLVHSNNHTVTNTEKIKNIRKLEGVDVRE